MIAYRIGEDLSVTEVNANENDWMTADVVWASLAFDRDNHIFYDDEALWHSDVVMARVGMHARIPLPAYVTGMDGEGRGDPTIPIEVVRFSVS